MAGSVVSLTVTKGPEEGRAFEVKPGQTSIMGRSSKADITLRDMGISRIHCQVTNDGTRCLLEDLNSKNGTLVNGERIATSTALQNGDVIRIGTSALRVRVVTEDAGQEIPPVYEAGPAAAPAPPPQKAAPGPVAPDGDLVARGRPGEEAAAGAPGAVPSADSSEDAAALMGAFDHWLDDSRAAKPEKSDQPTPASSGPSQDIAGEGDAPGASAEPVRASRGIAEVAAPDIYPIAGEEEGALDIVQAEPAQPDALLGRVIAGCRIEERVGRDALSTIYRATQVSMDRPVELRLLAEDMTRDQSAVERFVASAKACGRLTHPHILQVYDAGQAEGLYYVALERVDGQSIHDLLKRAGAGRPLPVETCLEVGVQIAGALAHAHAQGIVHGGINVDNILVTRHGIAKLAELGFAKGLEDSGIGGTADRRLRLGRGDVRHAVGAPALQRSDPGRSRTEDRGGPTCLAPLVAGGPAGGTSRHR